MQVYTRRAQTVLTKEQYEELIQIAKERNKPISVLIREAIEQTHLANAALQRRQDALKHLISLKAPSPDWEEMEREIIQGSSERNGG